MDLLIGKIFINDIQKLKDGRIIMPPLKYKQQLAKARKASNARELQIAKQYFQAGPSISNLYNAFMHWYNSVPVLGGQPEDGNLYITGEAPNPGMRNPKDIVQTAKSVVNIGNAIKRNSKILQKLTKIAKSKSSNAIQPRNNTNILENPPQEIYVDFENLPGFSERDLALQQAMQDAGSGSTYSLSYFGMSPRQVYERAMQDWQNIPVGSSFALVADGALSTDSAPMVYGMMSRFKDEAKEVSKGFECGIQIENYNEREKYWIKYYNALKPFGYKCFYFSTYIYHTTAYKNNTPVGNHIHNNKAIGTLDQVF